MAQGYAKSFIFGSVAGLRRLARCSLECFARSRQYLVAHSHDGGAFDSLFVERAGLIRLEGWAKPERIQEVTFPKCFLNDRELEPLEAFRTYRPDVAAATGTHNFFLGLVITYRLREDMRGAVTHLRLTYGDATILDVSDAFYTAKPPYSDLLDGSKVYRRENIYGVGPPAPIVSEEVKRLSTGLSAPVLDFGCGSGFLVTALRAQNIEAYGIEVDRALIIESLLPDAKEFIRIYDGSLPLPFADEEFQSVIATEVIEHIPEYGRVLAEIARITRLNFLISVPDMSSIPICHHNNVVPWHLLEATHVNFFTQTSLERVLRKHFRDIQFARIGPTVTNGSKWFGSLVAICRK